MLDNVVSELRFWRYGGGGQWSLERAFKGDGGGGEGCVSIAACVEGGGRGDTRHSSRGVVCDV